VDSKPGIIIVAGPNGAGKTTFVENFLNRYLDCDEFLNADLIAAGLSPFAPERQNLRAAELFFKRMAELEQGKLSFALETTLSGLTYRRRIKRWQNEGFKVTLLFLWLPSAEMAVQRVQERVAQGGHNIPELDIRRRYRRGIRNLTSIYLPMVDDAWILNGSQAPPSVIWKRHKDAEQVFDHKTWREIRHSAKEPS
jgi:predicted ABC-type ATPase